MRRFGLYLCVMLVVAVGCGHAPSNAKLALPAPALSTTVGPGDVFAVVVVGEQGLPSEFRVQPDG